MGTIRKRAGRLVFLLSIEKKEGRNMLEHVGLAVTYQEAEIGRDALQDLSEYF